MKLHKIGALAAVSVLAFAACSTERLDRTELRS